MNLLKIAFSNIKKRKSSSVSFFAIVVMSAIMLSIALSLLFNTNSFYERKRTQLNSGDILIAVPDEVWTKAMEVYIDEYDGVSDYQITNAYSGEIKYYSENTETSKSQFLIGSTDQIENQVINMVGIVDELKNKPAVHIYLPLGFKYSGFKTGEKFYLESASKTYEYIIAGFFEDAQMGASTMGVKTLYVDTQSYHMLAGDWHFKHGYIIAIQFDDIVLSYLFQTAFYDHFNINSGLVTTISYELVKMTHIMFALIMAFILIIVASIVLTIALIVVRFNINNSISEDIRSLGALKSIGFTSKQIIFSIILQFLFIALIGSTLGVIIGRLSINLVGNAVTATSGLLWSNTSLLGPAVIAIVVICFVTVVITFITAGKSKFITPIVALRGGVTAHSFKKNYAPLEKSKLSLNVALAAKTLLNNFKSNVTAFIVVVMFGFMTVLGFTLYHNFVLDTSTFVEMLGLEPAQVQMGVLVDEDIDIINNVKKMDNVTKLARFGLFTTKVDEKTIDIYVWEDIFQKERNSLIAGRYPIYDNEISLLASAQKMLNKQIGDVIDVEYEGVTKSFLVVGITQGVSGDCNSEITFDGFKRLKNDAVLKNAYVYLEETDSKYVDNFIKELRLNYGEKIFALNLPDAIDSTLIAIKGPIAIATYVILFINITTLIFVFFLIASTIIRRKNRDLGIMKALGFTTKQLMLQILLAFFPSIVMGLLIGAFLGVICTNPLLGLMFAGLGIARATFIIPAIITIIVQIILLLVCLFTVMLVAMKIRKIAPQKLIAE